MASSSSSSSSPPTLFSTVFLIAIFLTSIAHARESQFFNKATKDTTAQQVPNHQQQEAETPTKLQDQQQANDPNFIPEETPTNSIGYGLYGHETRQLPPSATTASTVPQESLYSNYQQNYNDKYYYNNNNEHYDSHNDADNYYYNKDSYLTDEERAVAAYGNRYSTAARGGRNTYYPGGNVRQEGMSDTRFLENGKYFYDINNEEKYYPNYRYNKYSRMPGSRSGEYYNMNMVNGGRRYQGNYRNPSYDNHDGNSAERYGQNQEDEFQDEQDEFVP
ncbi:hypothetical protein SAY86_010889 [Trapa natans]|uniref:Protein E6 n=1 Tax=Trapa natans TaxID=22666 RepID=A0AAN7LX84_TRANT|nr:hypothetical protein SAY86_010889 [Trapa natans]